MPCRGAFVLLAVWLLISPGTSAGAPPPGEPPTLACKLLTVYQYRGEWLLRLDCPPGGLRAGMRIRLVKPSIEVTVRRASGRVVEAVSDQRPSSSRPAPRSAPGGAGSRPAPIKGQAYPVRCQIVGLYPQPSGPLVLHLDCAMHGAVRPGMRGVVLQGAGDAPLPGGEVTVIRASGQFALATTSLTPSRLPPKGWVRIERR